MGLVLVAAALLVGGLVAVQAAANSPATRSATSPASRVFPAPPGPVTVTSRRSPSNPATSATAPARPTKLVSAGAKPGYDPCRGTRRRPTRPITLPALRPRAARPRGLRPRLGRPGYRHLVDRTTPAMISANPTARFHAWSACIGRLPPVMEYSAIQASPASRHVSMAGDAPPRRPLALPGLVRGAGDRIASV